MSLSKNGKFNYFIEPKNLSKGLRPSINVNRNSRFLSTCDGAVGNEYAIHSINQLSAIDTSLLSCSFPYPQIFVFNSIIIVCTSTDIYELLGISLVHKLTVTGGLLWTAVDFFNYVYLSNNIVSVIRDAYTFQYSISSDVPVTRSICNFNGQLLIESNIERV
jgi:hypothetical protein